MEKSFEVRDIRKRGFYWKNDEYLNGWAKKCGVYATAIYDSLCRHADKEQMSFPSRRKIAEEHNISIRQVARAISILESFNIIKRERIGKKANNRYWLKDKSEWTDSPISDVPHSPVTRDSQSHHLGTDSPLHSKDTHIKETHSKDIATVPVADNTNLLIELFKGVNPSYKRLFVNRTERAAVERMVGQMGEEKFRSLVSILPKIVIQPFAPKITTPYILEKKMGELGIFIKQQEAKNNKYKVDFV